MNKSLKDFMCDVARAGGMPLTHAYGSAARAEAGGFVTSLRGFDPEVTAMLQAFYSRSHKPILERIEDFNAESSEDIKEKLKVFAIQYNHASILDCGSVTFFFENVSMLAAKAIEDFQLFNGQETSSRYIDFSQSYMFTPQLIEQHLSDTAQRIQRQWMGLYKFVFDNCFAFYQQQNPEADAVTVRGLRAKAFDVARGYLPAGCTTQVSLHGELRNVYTQLYLLTFHPLEEVASLAMAAVEVFKLEYPNSVLNIPNEQVPDSCYANFENILTYSEKQKLCEAQISKVSKFEVHESSILPIVSGNSRLNTATSVEILGVLDFGAFRDIHRQRNGICLMPLLDPRYGFHDHYITEAEACLVGAEHADCDLRAQVQELVVMSSDLFAKLEEPSRVNGRVVRGDALISNEIAELQYMMPLGTLVPTYVQYDLQQLIYVLNLRSSPAVHTTLRQFCAQAHEKLTQFLDSRGINADEVGLGLKPLDTSLTDASRRGKHTITTADGVEIK